MIFDPVPQYTFAAPQNKIPHKPMKNLLLSFVLLLPFFGFSQALSGNYVINSSNTNTNFQTLAKAVLHINSVGVSGPVTFFIDQDQNVTSPIIVNQFTGTSATNTLTIKPNVGKNIIISGNIDNSGLIVINNADNVVIDGSNTLNGSSRNLTVNNNSSISYSGRAVIFITNSSNGSDNIEVKNLKITFSNRNQDPLLLAGIYSGSSISNPSSYANSKIRILNNEFPNVRQAIYLNGNSSLKTNEVTIANNMIGNEIDNSKPSVGIQLININNFNIIDNNIEGLLLSSNAGYETIGGIFIQSGSNFNIKRNILNNIQFTQSNGATLYGMQIKGTVFNGIISENKISKIKNTGQFKVRGLELDIDNSISSNLLIKNNFLSDVTSAGSNDDILRGLSVVNGKDIKIYNNTISLSANLGGVSQSAAIYFSSGSVLDIRNNIFNNQSTGKPYAINSNVNSSAFTFLDYNDYYSAQNIGKFNNTEISSLANWKTATGKDTNSLSILPIFTSATDLHLTVENTTLDNKGLPLPSVITDIDDEVRSTSTPDMGADEFTAARCGSSTTWNGTDWSNGNPNNTKKAIIAGNYSSISFIACELQINSNVTVNVAADKYIQVVNGIVNNGTLVLENTASLIQIENDATYTGNPITVKKITAPMKRYDFTYWSSPVIGYTLQALSPDTLGDKYYSYNPTTGWTIHYNGAATMTAGTGYIVRAPQSYSITDSQVFSTQFVGLPNTGNITQPIVANASNLIGNPYPSAISADAIFSANSGVIDGTFYFWTHNSLPSTANSGNATYNYSSDDYASYNGVGGVKTKSAVTGGQTPTGNIASGQSFFIAGKTNGNVTFSNSMRVKAGNNSQFFRTSNSTQSEEEEPVAIEKNRLWLNISNEAGDFNETLIGYVSNATNGLDKAFDGVNLSSGTTTLYSIIDTNNLVIQGRALPFTNTDVVPLGMKISTAGQYTINMDQFDGLFTSQNIYLFDSLTNTTHDLKASDYVFNSEIGTFNSRFEIRYVNGTELGIDTPIVSNNDVIVYKTGNQIAVKATNFTIDNIQVYDLTGKVIFSKAKVNSNEFATSGLNVGTQVVIVKVNLDNNQSVSKKVIMN